MLQTAGCEGFVIFIIIFIVISIISSANKSTQQRSGGGGGTLFDELSGTTGMTGSNTSGGFELGGGSPYSTPITPVKKSRPPINWNIIRLNMTQEQINDCFDMSALSRGVKKADLPQYVNMKKLRNYFSEAQLSDMIDLDFFDGKQEITETPSLSGSRQRSKPLTLQPSLSKELPGLKPLKSTIAPAITTVKPKLKEIVEEKIPDKSFKEETPAVSVFERFDSPSIYERFETPEVDEGMCREHALTPRRTSRPAVNLRGIDLRAAFVMKEILTPPPSVTRYREMYRHISQYQSANGEELQTT